MQLIKLRQQIFQLMKIQLKYSTECAISFCVCVCCEGFGLLIWRKCLFLSFISYKKHLRSFFYFQQLLGDAEMQYLSCLLLKNLHCKLQWLYFFSARNTILKCADQHKDPLRIKGFTFIAENFSCIWSFLFSKNLHFQFPSISSSDWFVFLSDIFPSVYPSYSLFTLQKPK